jgi:hypothetical protein
VNRIVVLPLCAFYPRVGRLPGLDELAPEARIEELRRDATGLFWLGVVAAALFFHVTPILTVRRPVLAGALSPDDLDRHTAALAGHPIYLVRQLVMMLKLVGGLFWAASPEVRACIALPPYPPDPGTRRGGEA